MPLDTGCILVKYRYIWRRLFPLFPVLGDTFEAPVSFQVPVSVNQRPLERGCVAVSAPKLVPAKRRLWGLVFLNYSSCSVWWDSCCTRVSFVHLGRFVSCPVRLVVGELFHRWLWVLIYTQHWIKLVWLQGKLPVLASPTSFQLKSGDWISHIETLEPAQLTLSVCWVKPK